MLDSSIEHFYSVKAIPFQVPCDSPLLLGMKSAAKLLRSKTLFDDLQSLNNIKNSEGQNLLSQVFQNKKVEDLSNAVRQAIINFPPIKLDGELLGCGGNYAISDADCTIAIFKPVDEEPHAENNSKPFERWKGIRPGEGAVNECAVFLLDLLSECFYRVPPTTLTLLKSDKFFSYKVLHQKTKIGSIQYWIKPAVTWKNLTQQKKCAFKKNDIHKIALLDMRILNYDRNPGNILNVEDLLIPIDHGPVFCDDLGEKFNWCWMETPEAHEKFDETLKLHIKAVDSFKDSIILRKKLGIRRKALFQFNIVTIFIKHAICLDFTPYEMGIFIGANGYTTGENPLFQVIKFTSDIVKRKVGVDTCEKKTYLNQVFVDEFFTTLPNVIDETLLLSKRPFLSSSNLSL